MSAAEASTPAILGHILTPKGWVAGALLTAQGRVQGVQGPAVSEAQALAEAAQTGSCLIVPGFIDLHLHGGGGHDVMDAGAAVAHIAATHARSGTTAWLATTMTAPSHEIEAALRAVAQAMALQGQDQDHSRGLSLDQHQSRSLAQAQILGVHLEGPFISEQRLGAQPNFAVPGTFDQIKAWHALAPIALVTLAPEAPSHLELIAQLAAAGFRVQLGHSGASYEQGKAALAAGACGFTHLFNAMSGLHHRAPGLVGAALAHARSAEIIPDLLHVHEGAIHAALRAIPGLYCVSDATAAAGMPDGAYRLGRQTVHKCAGGVRLADGTLAGSCLTLDRAFANLVGLGLSLQEASRRCSALPAQHVGLHDRGALQAGQWADAVALDQQLRVQQVWLKGRPVFV